MAVMSLGSLAGSTPAGKSAIELVAVVPISYTMVSGAGIELVDGLIVTSGPGWVATYGLDGRKRWEVHGEGLNRPIPVEFAPSRRLLLVRHWRPPALTRDGRVAEGFGSIALDLATGDRLWSLDAGLTPLGTVLLDVEAERIRAYGANPPNLLWQTGPLAASGVDPAQPGIFGLTGTNILVEYDPLTGRPVRSGPMPPPPADGWAGMRVKGDRILLLPPIGAGEVVAVDRETFAPVAWSAPLGPDFDCGPVTCVQILDGALHTGVVDNATSELLWIEAGRRLIPIPAGMLAVSEAATGGFAPVEGLLDPFTGEVRAALPGWYIAEPSHDGVTILVRPHPNRTELAVLDTGGLRVIGTVPHAVDACRYPAGVLICDLTSGGLGVWRLNP